MGADTLLDERGVTITTTKAVLGGTTYPLGGVTSVGLSSDGPHRAGGFAWFLVGVAMMLKKTPK